MFINSSDFVKIFFWRQFAKSPHRYGNSRAIWNHIVLPATRQTWHSRLYPAKFVLDLVTSKGCRAKLTKYSYCNQLLSFITCFHSNLDIYACRVYVKYRRIQTYLLNCSYCPEAGDAVNSSRKLACGETCLRASELHSYSLVAAYHSQIGDHRRMRPPPSLYPNNTHEPTSSKQT